jgi:hypothetical protein
MWIGFLELNVALYKLGSDDWSFHINYGYKFSQKMQLLWPVSSLSLLFQFKGCLDECCKQKEEI